MNFNYKHIIWDWNGTLINDAELCVEIINELLGRRNIQGISLREYQDVFDFPVINFYEKIGFDFSKEPFHIPAAEYIDAYNARRFSCSLHDGALELLSVFKKAGIAQSILSASKQSSLEEAVGYYSLESFFAHVCGLDDHYANGKIDIAKELIGRIGADNRSLLIIGDTTHDYEVARSLGAGCILISSGHHSREKLEQSGARVVDSIAEISNAAEVSE
ncbi:MAG: HAD family hydrolase [Spirochaetes bacterium]|nr:HAD family hydrolase [Spirochaetota bacterium]